MIQTSTIERRPKVTKIGHISKTHTEAEAEAHLYLYVHNFKFCIYFFVKYTLM